MVEDVENDSSCAESLTPGKKKETPYSSPDNSPALLVPKPLVLSEELASSITKDICNGLFQIHKKNFIHRDLKPENILIDQSNFPEGALADPSELYTAKIADFGLSAEIHANVFHGHDNINEVMGTILFMAPEQATGQRYGKRVDMWALGIIVF